MKYIILKYWQHSHHLRMLGTGFPFTSFFFYIQSLDKLIYLHSVRFDVKTSLKWVQSIINILSSTYNLVILQIIRIVPHVSTSKLISFKIICCERFHNSGFCRKYMHTQFSLHAVQKSVALTRSYLSVSNRIKRDRKQRIISLV